MMIVQRSFCLLLVGWLSVCAGSLDARRSSAQRVRATRSPRLDLDHHSDLSHEGESHSLDTQFSHHHLLEVRSGAVHSVALAIETGTPTVLAAVVVAAWSFPSAVEPAFQSTIIITPPGAERSAQIAGLRGRAPPALSL